MLTKMNWNSGNLYKNLILGKKYQEVYRKLEYIDRINNRMNNTTREYKTKLTNVNFFDSLLFFDGKRKKYIIFEGSP